MYGAWNAGVSPSQFDVASVQRASDEWELWVPASNSSTTSTSWYVWVTGGSVLAANAETATALEDCAVARGTNLMQATRALAPYQKHWYFKRSARRYALNTQLCDFAPGPRSIFMSAYFNASAPLDAMHSDAGCFGFEGVQVSPALGLSYRRPVCPVTVYLSTADRAQGLVHVGARDPLGTAAGSGPSTYLLSAWNSDADDAVALPGESSLRALGLGADLVLLLAEGGGGGDKAPSYHLYTSGTLDTRMSNQSVYTHRLLNHACFVQRQAAAFGLNGTWDGSATLVQAGALRAAGFYRALSGPASAWPQVQVLVAYECGFTCAYSAIYPPAPLLPDSQLHSWPGAARAAVAVLAVLSLLAAAVIGGLVWRLWTRQSRYTTLN